VALQAAQRCLGDLLGGRALRAGDELPVGKEPSRSRGLNADLGLSLPKGGARLRVVEGPHADMFDGSALAALYGSRYLVTPSSNRMGYRLEGPILRHRGPVWRFAGKAFVGDELCAEAEYSAMLTDLTLGAAAATWSGKE
jgi:allophanate hydrolase subunit 2